MFYRHRAALIAATCLVSPAVLPSISVAQSGDRLPSVIVEQREQNARPSARRGPAPQRRAARIVQARPAPAPSEELAAQPLSGAPIGAGAGIDAPPGAVVRQGSLGVPTAEEARIELSGVPGAVEVVPQTAYEATPQLTLKDALDYVPGVFVQPKWGEDSRLSIRGSGLSRNFHLRSIQLYQDGVPLNTADGYGDFQEIDPSAYKYIEVYKGANALRYGANSLGGAINFVTATGYDSDPFQARVDAGSFGFRRAQASAGGVSGVFDAFVTASLQEQDGFREHSDGDAFRGSGNLGVRLSPNAETRFYLNGANVNQRIPGAVTREIALTDPERAAANNVLNDWKRDVDTIRFANKTALRLAPGTLLEIGAFGLDRHLMHPIFQWLDYEYRDYGGFARLHRDFHVGSMRNRFLAGVNLHNGEVDQRQFVNVLGSKGALTYDGRDTSKNTSLYFENALYVAPALALVAGGQFLDASREREDFFLGDGNGGGKREDSVFSPKIGLLWDVAKDAQVFANISRSAEVPSFGEGFQGVGAPADVKTQRATTYEIGSRGRRETYSWDVALYRAEIDDELQCLDLFGFSDFCQVVNADRTIHQGVELGFGASLVSGILAQGPNPDRLWLNTAYAYNDFRFDDDASWGDNDLPGAPRHFLRAELLYKHPSGLFFGPNVEWVPEAYFVDNANTVETEAYALLGAKIGYDAGEAWFAFIEARNLTDEKYIASVSIAPTATAMSALFEPGNGRAVYAGLQYRW
jgi:iron complex outermembrane receptor protein